jgi:hypothetical protein
MSDNEDVQVTITAEDQLSQPVKKGLAQLPVYWVDWRDQSFPVIRDDAERWDVTGVTLWQAKTEIFEYTRNLMEHLRQVNKDTFALTVGEVATETKLVTHSD